MEKKTKTVFIERNKLFKNIPMILMNNIMQIDEGFFEDNTELFYTECEECHGSGEKDGKSCEECGGNGSHETEYYQYFISDPDEWEVERLKSYGVDIGYSQKLEKHIICIGDYGTSWSAFSYSKEVPEYYELQFDETLTRSTVY